MSPEPRHYLENARDAIDVERDRSVCDKAAFRAFADRVGELEPATAGDNPPAGDTPDVLHIRTDSSGATTEAVWTAFCETVIAVPHFDDYAETPLEHLRTELGDDVAVLITDREELTPYHKQVIASRVEASIDLREEQLEKMDAEAAMVNQAEELLREATGTLEDWTTDTILEMSMEEMEAVTTQLQEFSARCDQLLTDRQEQLDSRPEAKRVDRESTVGYLYRNLDVNFPVIVALTNVRARLQSLTSDLEAAMTTQ